MSCSKSRGPVTLQKSWLLGCTICAYAECIRTALRCNHVAPCPAEGVCEAGDMSNESEEKQGQQRMDRSPQCHWPAFVCVSEWFFNCNRSFCSIYNERIEPANSFGGTANAHCWENKLLRVSHRRDRSCVRTLHSLPDRQLPCTNTIAHYHSIVYYDTFIVPLVPPEVLYSFRFQLLCILYRQLVVALHHRQVEKGPPFFQIVENQVTHVCSNLPLIWNRISHGSPPQEAAHRKASNQHSLVGRKEDSHPDEHASAVLLNGSVPGAATMTWA